MSKTILVPRHGERQAPHYRLPPYHPGGQRKHLRSRLAHERRLYLRRARA